MHIKDALYKRIERVMGLTIWEENMIVYQKLLTALVEVNRFDHNSFKAIEDKVMSNLSMEYDLRRNDFLIF
jgi:hypothetical protein